VLAKLLANWRTSLAGVVPLLVGLDNLVEQAANIVAQSPAAPASWHTTALNMALVAAGIGHIFAQDAKKPPTETPAS